MKIFFFIWNTVFIDYKKNHLFINIWESIVYNFMMIGYLIELLIMINYIISVKTYSNNYSVQITEFDVLVISTNIILPSIHRSWAYPHRMVKACFRTFLILFWRIEMQILKYISKIILMIQYMYWTYVIFDMNYIVTCFVLWYFRAYMNLLHEVTVSSIN